MFRRPLLLLTSLLLFGALVASAFAYAKPAGGKWDIVDLFDATDGGSMKVSGNGRALKRLKLKVGDSSSHECGNKIVLRKKAKIRRFNKAGGRRAVGRLASSGLIVPVKAKYKVDGKKRTGKLIMLWDEDGRQTDTARVEFGDCFVNFIGRK